jgi:opacity protein-like surface antigen
MGFGHWFKQVPVSVGVSGTMDFFNAAVKEQTTRDNTLTVDGVLQPQATFTKYRTDIFQIVPAVNLIVGVPLKFFRVYGGVGPGLFMSIYDFTLKGTNTTSHVTAFDTKIGYNAFFGADFFISKHVSAFVEGKYSQVDGLTFTPAPSQIGGRNLTERYNSLKTQRVAVGASYHF